MATTHALSFPQAERRTHVDAGLGPRRRQADVMARRFDDAMHLLTHQQWAPAFDVLAGLANSGHPAAARMALMLARRGAALFGMRFAASAQDKVRWQQLGG
jgi:orotate phosphoribosyltransferase